MEAEQQQQTPALALATDMPSAPHTRETDTVMAPVDVQREKVDVDVPLDDEADAIQPAAHTLAEASPPPPVSVPAPLSSSPGKRNRRKNSRRSSENGEANPIANEDFASLNGSHPTRSKWMDDTDAESGSSQPDDSRVTPFDFGAGESGDHRDTFGEEFPKGAPTPLVTGTKMVSPQRSSESQGIEDLISLPSPVANSASGPGFGVFALSPLNKSHGAIAHEQASPLAPPLREQPVAETLTPILSALNLKANDVEEAPSEGEAVFPDESPANEREHITKAQGVQPAEEMLADLSISSHDPEPTLPVVDEPEPNKAPSPLQQPAPSPAFSRTAANLASVSVVDNVVENVAAAESADSNSPSHFKPSSPDHSLPSIPISFATTAPASESSVKEKMLQPEAQAVSVAETSEPPVSPALGETSVYSSPEPSPPKATEEQAITSSAKTSPPKASKVTKSNPENKASTDSKPRDGRILSRPPAKTAKSDEGVKVKAQAPSKTSLIKPKTERTTSAIAPGATKPGPLKPKVQRAVVSSVSQPSERVPKATSSKPSTPAAPARARKDTPLTLNKQKVGSATPPPAPSSTPPPEGINSIKTRLSSSELEATSNRLYADALESKKRKEVRKAELEETFSFTPQVNTSKRHAVPDDKNRFVALHEKAKEAIKRKEDLKQKREKSECTFKPKITAKARKLSGKTSKPRYENLYQNAHEIQMKREEKKSENDRKAVEECSFKPKIKTMRSPTKSRPLYDAERLKQKKLALEQKKIEAELSQCTFKPKVVAKSTKAKSDEAGEKGASEAKLFDRLYQASQTRAENLEKLRHEREEQERSIATFQPKITSSNTGKGGSKQPFHERLYSKDYMQKVTADREQKKLEEEQKFSYKPQIALGPDGIKAKQSSSASSSPDKSIFERLYEEKDKVREKIELSEEIKMQKEMVGCTFRPHIETSPNHPKSQPGVPIWERLLSYDKNQVVEEREKQKQQLEMQECTFKPEVKPSDYFTPKKSPSGGVFDRLAGGAVSMPPPDMKRRESERKALSVGQSKRRSVPELGASKDQPHAASIGAIVKSSKTVLSPETSPDSSANQPRSLPSSLQSSDLEKLSRSNGETTTNNKHFATGRPDQAEFLADERSGPEDATTFANNRDEQLESQSQSILENYDSWTSNLEAKMRSLA